MPPFIDAGTGLDASGLTLSIKMAAPIAPAGDAVGLKVGAGLSVDSAGALVSSAAALQAAAPLSIENGKISLRTQAPFFADDSGALGIRLGSGLGLLGDTLRVQTGEGLSTRENLLVSVPPSYQPPLEGNVGSASLEYGQGLALSGKALVATIPTYVAPLKGDGSSVTLSLGRGLSVTAEGDLEATSTTSPPSYAAPLQEEGNTVSLAIGQGLYVSDQGKLQATSPTPPSYLAPLQETGNAVSLSLGSGLSVNDSGALVATGGGGSELLTFTAPLSKGADSDVSLQIGQGLAVQSGTLVATGSPTEPLTFTAPLTESGGTVALSRGPGLSVSGTQLYPSYENLTVNIPLNKVVSGTGTSLSLLYDPNSFTTSNRQLVSNPTLYHDILTPDPGSSLDGTQWPLMCSVYNGYRFQHYTVEIGTVYDLYGKMPYSSSTVGTVTFTPNESKAFFERATTAFQVTVGTFHFAIPIRINTTPPTMNVMFAQATYSVLTEKLTFQFGYWNFDGRMINAVFNARTTLNTNPTTNPLPRLPAETTSQKRKKKRVV